MNKTFSKTRILVECALMVALATVLGFIPVYELPRGGSVTLVSMVPILLVILCLIQEVKLRRSYRTMKSFKGSLKKKKR